MYVVSRGTALSLILLKKGGKVKNLWEFFNPITKHVSQQTQVKVFYHFIKLASSDSTCTILTWKIRHFCVMINDFYVAQTPQLPPWRKKNAYLISPPTLSSHQVPLSEPGDLWWFRFWRQVEHYYISSLRRETELFVLFNSCLCHWKSEAKFMA